MNQSSERMMFTASVSCLVRGGRARTPVSPSCKSCGHGTRIKLADRKEVPAAVSIIVEVYGMCRNIKTLFNFDPPVTEEETRAAALQFVRKITGFNKPSKANEAIFMTAVDEIAAIAINLLGALETNAPPKNREEEAAKARARAADRFGR